MTRKERQAANRAKHARERARVRGPAREDPTGEGSPADGNVGAVAASGSGRQTQREYLEGELADIRKDIKKARGNESFQAVASLRRQQNQMREELEALEAFEQAGPPRTIEGCVESIRRIVPRLPRALAMDLRDILDEQLSGNPLEVLQGGKEEVG